MTRVILDGRYIQDHFPGIGRYVFNLAKSLASISTTERIRLLHDPRLVNTRFDLASLGSKELIELVALDAPTRSLREQWLGVGGRHLAGANLWHSAYYIMPYALRLPSVVTIEDLSPLIVPEMMPGALQRLLYRSLVKLATSRASQVITLSLSASRDLKRLLNLSTEKISVIPLAADGVFHPREVKETAQLRERFGLDRYVLYLGSNKPHKNLERLLRAWALVAGDFKLVIAGHWDERYTEAVRLAQELSLGDRVLFRSNVDSQELPILLCGASAFVFPSLYEGFGLPVLEAMASGAPVICSNTSSLPEVVGDAACLFNPLSAQEIASAVNRVLEDTSLADTMRTKGLARASCFSWDRTARETEAVYSAVLAGR